MKFALVQANYTVGDIAGNLDKIKQAWQRAEKDGADLVIFPEMTITGYPVEDLSLQPAFRRAAMQAVEALLEFSKSLNCAAVVGGLWEKEEHSTNSLFFIGSGKLLHRQHKIALPNYGVFDEKRHFKPGNPPAVCRWKGLRIGFLICEDLWHGEPARILAEQGVDMFISVNGSPFETSKLVRRHAVARKAATTHDHPLIYVNMVAGQDEIVMDGGSFAMNARGEILHQMPHFEEAFGIIDWPLQASGIRHQAPGEEEMLYRAMTLGLGDYVRKSGFTDVTLGLSGGIDSALTLAVAVDALGKEHVHPVFMPSPYTSQESIEDAQASVRLLDVKLKTLPIEPAVAVMENTLAPLFAGTSPGITEENIQSRIRGNLLMALSNKFGWMLVTTGNKSELATGYATLYGDMCGAYNPLKDLYKTKVTAVSKWRNAQGAVMPERVISKPPSAELRPDQKDEDSLPPYDLMDKILEQLIEHRRSADAIIGMGYDEATVRNVAALLLRSEYKRRQAAPGLTLTPLAFGRDWRFPLVNGFRG